MASVHDVATYILDSHGEMTTMKLQKLCYYSQGWSLAWDGEPIFEEPIRAWANGPVVYELFSEHQGQFTVKTWNRGRASALTAEQKETIDAVLNGYGHLSGKQLSAMSHGERPWLDARQGLEPGASSTRTISLDTMQEFFGGLANSR